MATLFFTTGQAAQELHVSSAQIRALCESGAVQAETTFGGQWRIPADLLERLRRDGLPPIPRPLPNQNATPARNGTRRSQPELWAEPSESVVTAAEQVAITRSQLEKRKIDRELEETEDWFRERDYENAQRQAERERVERTRSAEDARTGWLQQWEIYALNRIHPSVPAQTRLEAHETIRARLAGLTPIPADAATKEIVDAVLEATLESWLRAADILTVMDEVLHNLLPRGRRWERPT